MVNMAKYTMPGEWEKHASVWLAWPSAENLWEDNLRPAQAEFIELCRAIVDLDPASGAPRGERLNVLIPDTKSGADAETALRGLPVRFHLIPFGDIWLRDTAPLFLRGENGLVTQIFAFNGWGEKYSLPHDPEVATRIAEVAGFESLKTSFVLEGGSVELDGEGTCLTSRQCLLNENRNPSMDQTTIEKNLCETLGVEKVLWVGDGLINDHTDGHIDTIARYVAPGKVLCMRATTADDPNREIMEKIEADLRQMTDAKGRKLEVGTVPSPGAVLNEEGDLMPASYLNFYIGNTTVVVPTYGSPMDDQAVAEIAKWFPGRRTVGRSAKAILSGGGAFHCISQQEPEVLKK
jgi:agmatine deiminase